MRTLPATDRGPARYRPGGAGRGGSLSRRVRGTLQPFRCTPVWAFGAALSGRMRRARVDWPARLSKHAPVARRHRLSTRLRALLWPGVRGEAGRRTCDRGSLGAVGADRAPLGLGGRGRVGRVGGARGCDRGICIALERFHRRDGKRKGERPVSGSSIEALRERFPRVAVVHEWLTIPGGSEDVVIELLEMFPHAELFTSIYDPEPWPEIVTERPVHASYLSRVPGAKTHYPKLLPFMTRAYRAFDFSCFDLILSSSHACAKNIRTPPGALHVCYCHTPMRYAWDESLLEGEEIGRATRLALPLMLRRLRR